MTHSTKSNVVPISKCLECGLEHIGIRLSNRKHTCVKCGAELPK